MDTIQSDSHVHVAVINHRHGSNVYVHKSEEGLCKAIYAYVREYWEENNTDELPTDQQVAISAYFEDAADETLTMDSVKLED